MEQLYASRFLSPSSYALLTRSQGSVAFNRYAILLDSQYEFDYRQIPDNFSTGFVPFGTLAPGEYPSFIYGSDVFELNDNLRARVVSVAKTAELVDDAR